MTLRPLVVLHSAQRGGANEVVLGLLRHRPPGVEPAVVFLQAGPDLERVLGMGLPAALVETGRARQPWRAPGAIRRLRGAIRRHHADVVFPHVAKAQLYGSPAARLEGLPVVWWQQEWVGHAPAMQAVAARLPVDLVICSSDHTAADQRRRSPGTRVERVHLGVEPPAAPPREHVGEGRVVGIVGRLQRWKRVELAIDAMAHLPGVTLRVIGGTFPGLDEDYPAELRERAGRLGVAGRVDFAGEVPDGAAAIRELDVLVHCADHEPFGLVLPEAMLAGVPVVAPAHGGPAEIVRDGTDGLLVDVERPEAIAGAVAALLADPQRRAKMGAAGREHALERFTAARMAADAWALVAQRAR